MYPGLGIIEFGRERIPRITAGSFNLNYHIPGKLEGSLSADPRT
jgi:hypothetical protein